jgi:hypothetical protein
LNAVAEFSEALTLDLAERPVDFESTRAVDGVSSTQRLLDELLGSFDDDSSPTSPTYGYTAEFCVDSDE